MLKVNNIEVMFNETLLILKGISLDVPDKGLIAFLGANGAGKTTTLKAVCGILGLERGKVTDGSIIFNGREIKNLSPDKIVNMGISMVPENRRIFGDLTVEENLRVGAFTQKAGKTAINMAMEEAYTLFPNLKRMRKLRSIFLSGGEQQMLVMGRALMAKPKLLLLDEPSLGLAPLISEEIFKIIKKVNEEQGVAVLLVEQNANAAFALCNYAYIMENGKIVIDDIPEKLAENEDVRTFYLGVGRDNADKISFHDVKHYKRRKRWIS